MPYVRKTTKSHIGVGTKALVDAHFDGVKGMHTLPSASPAPLPGNLMQRSGFPARLNDWHQRIGRISGDICLSFKDGITEAKLKDLARKVRLLADEMGT